MSLGTRRTGAPPLLELGDVRLRPLRRADADAWYGYLSDPLVVERTSFDIRACADVEALIDELLDGYRTGAAFRWAIARAGDDVLIGTVGLHDPQQGTMELGYDLTRDRWGKGIATRAARRAVAWGFDDLNLIRVQATVMEGHAASVRVLEKCGFQKEGVLRDYRLCRGVPRDFGIYAVLRRDRPRERSRERI